MHIEHNYSNMGHKCQTSTTYQIVFKWKMLTLNTRELIVDKNIIIKSNNQLCWNEHVIKFVLFMHKVKRHINMP